MLFPSKQRTFLAEAPKECSFLKLGSRAAQEEPTLPRGHEDSAHPALNACSRTRTCSALAMCLEVKTSNKDKQRWVYAAHLRLPTTFAL